MTRQPIRTVTATAILAALTHPLASAPAAAQSDNTMIEAVTVHPPVAARFQCSEHALGAEDHVPAALAADCGPPGHLTHLTGTGPTATQSCQRQRPCAPPFSLSR